MMNSEEIKDLISFLESSKLNKVILKQGDFELHLEKTAPSPMPIAALPPNYAPIDTAPAEPNSDGPTPPAAGQKEGNYVSSPMVGTFYSAASPDDPSFVKVGDKVSADTVICIVEAMKVMNEVKAGISGTVAEVLVENSQPVEFGTKMFRIV